jgi:hypothetical protein
MLENMHLETGKVMRDDMRIDPKEIIVKMECGISG